MCDCKGDAVRSELAIDEGKGRRIAATGAVDATYLISANRELINVRIARVGSPSAAVIVGVLRRRDLWNAEKNNEREKVFHVKPPVGLKYSPPLFLFVELS